MYYKKVVLNDENKWGLKYIAPILICFSYFSLYISYLLLPFLIASDIDISNLFIENISFTA